MKYQRKGLRTFILLFVLSPFSIFGQKIVSLKIEGNNEYKTTRINANSGNLFYTSDGNIDFSNIDSIIFYYQPSESLKATLNNAQVPYIIEEKDQEEIESSTGFNILRRDDYLIKNIGDTIWGNINNPTFEVALYQQVKIITIDQEKFNFKPNEILSYRINGLIFESHDIGDSKSKKVFLKLDISGYCNLYIYEYTSTTIYVPVSGSMNMAGDSKLKKSYFLRKNDEEIHKFNFSKLKKGTDLYFIDNVSLTTDIRLGKYKKKDLTEIVQAYNTDKQLVDSAQK